MCDAWLLKTISISSQIISLTFPVNRFIQKRYIHKQQKQQNSCFVIMFSCFVIEFDMLEQDNAMSMSESLLSNIRYLSMDASWKAFFNNNNQEKKKWII